MLILISYHLDGLKKHRRESTNKNQLHKVRDFCLGWKGLEQMTERSSLDNLRCIVIAIVWKRKTTVTAVLDSKSLVKTSSCILVNLAIFFHFR